MRCPRPEARSRRTEKPQVERRVANVPRKGTSTPRGVGPLVAPHGAPFPRIGRGAKEKEDGPSRGLDKEYGWRSVGSGCLTIESEKSGCRYTRRHGRTCSGHPRLLILQGRQDVDARDKRGHDSGKYRSRVSLTLARDDGKNNGAINGLTVETRSFGALLTMRREVPTFATLQTSRDL